jgi:hypothetical protein
LSRNTRDQSGQPTSSSWASGVPGSHLGPSGAGAPRVRRCTPGRGALGPAPPWRRPGVAAATGGGCHRAGPSSGTPGATRGAAPSWSGRPKNETPKATGGASMHSWSTRLRAPPGQVQGAGRWLSPLSWTKQKASPPGERRRSRPPGGGSAPRLSAFSVPSSTSSTWTSRWHPARGAPVRWARTKASPARGARVTNSPDRPRGGDKVVAVTACQNEQPRSNSSGGSSGKSRKAVNHLTCTNRG